MWLECAVALVHQIVIHCFLVECASLRVCVCARDCIPPSVFLWLWELCQLCIVSSLYELCVFASSFAKRQLTRRRCSCEADSPSHNWFRSEVEGTESECVVSTTGVRDS